MASGRLKPPGSRSEHRGRHGNAGKFEEITLRHWVETAPKYLVANNFIGVPHSTLDQTQKA